MQNLLAPGPRVNRRSSSDPTAALTTPQPGPHSWSDLAGQIREAHARAEAAVRDALHSAAEAGRLLLEVKSALPHGQFGPWVREHCPEIAPRTARLYMRVARHWPELEVARQDGNPLPLREAQRLLTGPRTTTEPVPASLPPWWGQVHELNKMFPWCERTVTAIAENLAEGMPLLLPITLYEGKILDGKLRYAACLRAGVLPRFETYEDVVARGFRGGPFDCVWSANMVRGHFSEGELAAYEGRLRKHASEVSA